MGQHRLPSPQCFGAIGHSCLSVHPSVQRTGGRLPKLPKLDQPHAEAGSAACRSINWAEPSRWCSHLFLSFRRLPFGLASWISRMPRLPPPGIRELTDISSSGRRHQSLSLASSPRSMRQQCPEIAACSKGEAVDGGIRDAASRTCKLDRASGIKVVVDFPPQWPSSSSKSSPQPGCST